VNKIASKPFVKDVPHLVQLSAKFSAHSSKQSLIQEVLECPLISYWVWKHTPRGRGDSDERQNKSTFQPS